MEYGPGAFLAAYIRQLVETHREENAEMSKLVPLRFAYETTAITINLGRRMGHSTAAELLVTNDENALMLYDRGCPDALKAARGRVKKLNIISLVGLERPSLIVIDAQYTMGYRDPKCYTLQRLFGPETNSIAGSWGWVPLVILG